MSDHIEVFYNNKRRHSFNNQVSTVKYEERYQQSLLSVKRNDSDSASILAGNETITRFFIFLSYLTIILANLGGNYLGRR